MLALDPLPQLVDFSLVLSLSLLHLPPQLQHLIVTAFELGLKQLDLVLLREQCVLVLVLLS